MDRKVLLSKTQHNTTQHNSPLLSSTLHYAYECTVTINFRATSTVPHTTLHTHRTFGSKVSFIVKDVDVGAYEIYDTTCPATVVPAAIKTAKKWTFESKRDVNFWQLVR